MRRHLAALLLALCAGAAHAGPSACGPTSVGATAAALAFPASGATGPPAPTLYLTIANSSPSNYLCIDVQPGGTAATTGSGCAAGSIYLGSLGVISWALPQYAPPAYGSIIASGVATPVTCNYQ